MTKFGHDITFALLENLDMRAIVAATSDLVIGNNNKIPWNIKEEMAFFRRTTLGGTVLMGRKTFESLPNGALPNRRNIVLTKSNVEYKNAEIFHSLQDAIDACSNEDEIFIIGGESVYKEALPLADCMYLTEVIDTPENADTFFPQFNKREWEVTFFERHQIDSRHKFKFNFVTYEKKN